MNIKNTGSSSYLERFIMAREMAISGYISKIITIEHKLTYKQIRRVYRYLKEYGYILKKKSRAYRSGATLIRNYISKIHASLLMQLYYNIGGKEVLVSINIEALTKAFTLYYNIYSEIPEVDNKKWLPFDITDAWCLADELRSNNAMIENCNICNCSYFTSINQSTSVDCPFCK